MDPGADVIESRRPPDGRPLRGPSRTVAALVGLALGVVAGSAGTVLLSDDPAPEVRAVALVQPPRQSLGTTVLPVDVLNAGGTPFVVQGVELLAGAADGLSADLAGDPRTVPVDDERQVLVRLRRECSAADPGLLETDVQLDVVLAGPDSLTRQPVRIGSGFAGFPPALPIR